MTITELGALGEFVGSIGVIATLVYLAIQIRQNTNQLHNNERALRRAENNAIMQNWSDLRRLIMSDASFAEITVRGRTDYGSLDSVERERVGAWASEVIWINYHVWQRVQESIFEPDQWDRARPNVVEVVRGPAGLAAWERMRRRFDSAFVEDVERALK
jgi:hypothetical protein